MASDFVQRSQNLRAKASFLYIQNRFAASRSCSSAMHAFWTHESIDPMWKGPPGSQGLLRDTQKPSETSKAALSPLFALQRSLATSG